MGILKADFDWISLLVILVAGIIGLIKATKKEKMSGSAGIPSEHTSSSEDATVEWLNNSENNGESTIQSKKESILAGDYYGLRKGTIREEKFEQLTNEEETENTYSFDIRQAIISSEILRRPEY